VLLIHSVASFRVASMSVAAHWASRGFVVLAADYPGLTLTDQLNNLPDCGNVALSRNVSRDLHAQLDALTDPASALAAFVGHVDTTRLAVAGHGVGECEAAAFGTTPGVQVVLAFSGSLAVVGSTAVQSILFVAGKQDTVFGYDSNLLGNSFCAISADNVKSAFQRSKGSPQLDKRLLGIIGGGTLVTTDLCVMNSAGQTFAQTIVADGVCGANQAGLVGLPALWDCGTTTRDAALPLVKAATAAVLEQTLLCQQRAASLDMLQTAYPLVGDLIKSP
ncbi:MAG: putative lipoprotein signal peptide, partial [Myxococcaceae bacterium]|nr:putative lipoprotein signal peptide [Myxococcaceae bacterium]